MAPPNLTILLFDNSTIVPSNLNSNPSSTDEIATQRRIQGVEEVLSAWKGWAKAFPDAKGSFDKEMVSGNVVVIELTWRAIHSGPLKLPGKDLAATGKKIEHRACQIIEVSGGRVKSLRHYFDLSSLLRQLGVMA